MTEVWRTLGRLDYSIIESLRLQRVGRQDPSAYVDHERYTKAAWTAAGPVVLDVAQNNNGHAGYRVFGPGATALEPRMPAILGLADPGPPPELVAARPLAPIVDGLRLLRLTTAISLVEMQAAIILQQRVTFTEAARAWRMMAERSVPAPRLSDSPPLMMPPRPADWSRLSQPEAKALGIDAQRWETLRVAALHASKIEILVDLDPPAARDRLTALGQHLRGHGPWTLGFLRGLALADPDVVPPGDVHLPHDVAELFTGVPVGSDERMVELLAPYAGHRFRIIRALVANVRRKP